MKSIFDFIVNTKIESFKFVNRFAEVVETPIAFYTDIKKGDIIIIHQNVFRTFYDMKGAKKVSRSFFQDDLFFVSIDQVYMYKNMKGGTRLTIDVLFSRYKIMMI